MRVVEARVDLRIVRCARCRRVAMWAADWELDLDAIGDPPLVVERDTIVGADGRLICLGCNVEEARQRLAEAKADLAQAQARVRLARWTAWAWTGVAVIALARVVVELVG